MINYGGWCHFAGSTTTSPGLKFHISWTGKGTYVAVVYHVSVVASGEWQIHRIPVI